LNTIVKALPIYSSMPEEVAWIFIWISMYFRVTCAWRWQHCQDYWWLLMAWSWHLMVHRQWWQMSAVTSR
jgi:hypothetical protein